MSTEETGLARRPDAGVTRAYATADELVARANLIQDVKKRVMKSGVHYGTVPGCGDKPTLLKPGAEKLLSAFNIGVQIGVEDLSTDDSIRYRVTTRGVHQGTGNDLGHGIGEASTSEEKWKWRRAYQDEWNDTPEDRRRKKHTSKGPLLQVRTNPADLANTVLKMAKKRSMVDLALTVTGSSDFFEQDIEEMDPETIDAVLNEERGRAPIQQPEPKKKATPQAKPEEPAPKAQEGRENIPPSAPPTVQPTAGGPTISEAQGKRFWALAKKGGKSDEQIRGALSALGVEHTRDIPKDEYEDICKWAEDKGAGDYSLDDVGF